MAILGLKGKVLDAYDGILTIKNKNTIQKKTIKNSLESYMRMEMEKSYSSMKDLFILLNTVIAMSKY